MNIFYFGEENIIFKEIMEMLHLYKYKNLPITYVVYANSLKYLIIHYLVLSTLPNKNKL